MNTVAELPKQYHQSVINRNELNRLASLLNCRSDSGHVLTAVKKLISESNRVSKLLKKLKGEECQFRNK